MQKKIPAKNILGNHPTDGLGLFLLHTDTYTKRGVPHRDLVEVDDGQRDVIVACFRSMLVRHHLSPESLVRDKRRREAMIRLGFEDEQKHIKRFPTNPSTQKGNLAEIILAEYLMSAAEVDIPIYRLRYNPNVDQSMKGDDVLAFDLDSDPVRLIVGESKYRKTSSKAAVTDMVDGLVRSDKGGVPVSLQFVADRLFETGNDELGEKVEGCAVLFALEKLRLDYVGLLMSDAKSGEKLNQHTENSPDRLAVISFGLDSPDAIIAPCYDGLEESL